MRTEFVPTFFEPAVEWSRHLRAIYSALSTSRFVDAAFGFLRATVNCDLLLYYDLAGGDEFSVLRHAHGDDQAPALSPPAPAFTPTTAYAHASPGTKFILSREILPKSEDELIVSPVYTDVLRPLGMRHSISIFFWGAKPSRFPESAFSVFRSIGRADFSEHEVAILEAAQLHIETALSCLKSRLAGYSKYDGLAAIVRNLPLGSILLNWHLDIVHANRAGVRNCISWLRGNVAENLKSERRDCRVPVEIKNACRELQRDWAASPKKKPRPKFRKTRRIEHPDQPGLRATVTLLCHRDATTIRPSFLIQIGRCDAAPISAPWARTSLLDLLTVSEREATLKAVDGLSNQEIASELGKTVCAIKFLLHSTFKKLQIPNRARLVALLRDLAPRRAGKTAPHLDREFANGHILAPELAILAADE